MLPEQPDILWTFVTIIFSLFSVFVFGNVIQHCRTKGGANTTLWGAVFGTGLIINLMLTNHMFDLNQQEQLGFISWQVLAVFLTLLAWGVFFKGEKIEDQSPPLIRAAFFYSTISILLAGYTNWLPQQRSDPPPKAAPVDVSNLTMEKYVEIGDVIVFGKERVAGSKAIGKGQCPLCHTFDPGDNIGRCPNLFGVEERSHTRIKEDRYLNEPIKIGETDGATGIVKGKPDQVPDEYRRNDPSELTGEDYLRESLMCPSCYVVKGYGKAGDTKSPMPVISKPPISLGKFELNAVIAWLQAKDTPGEFGAVTIPLPGPDDIGGGDKKEEEEEGEGPVFVTGAEPIDVMINKLGCPLCHTIPGIEGAVGELGPKLHEKINAPKRIKDPNYKGKAKTGRDYVRESILSPDAYIVFNEEAGESYPEGVMPQDFASKLSVTALDKLVDFISNTQPEG
jgi:hypothetical protein